MYKSLTGESLFELGRLSAKAKYAEEEARLLGRVLFRMLPSLIAEEDLPVGATFVRSDDGGVVGLRWPTPSGIHLFMFDGDMPLAGLQALIDAGFLKQLMEHFESRAEGASKLAAGFKAFFSE